MTSQKQLAANRENAKKSTGPRTTAGKAITRLNAVRDNVTGQITTLTQEEREIFDNLKADQLTALAPKTPDELKLADAIAWDTWRLNRLRAVESNMFALDAAEAQAQAEAEAQERTEAEAEAEADQTENAETDPNLITAIANVATYRNESSRLDNLSLYEQRMTRNLQRNRQTLHGLQTERKRLYEKDRQEEIVLARLNDLKDLPYQAPTEPSRNGSVFSSEEIRKAAERQRNLEATMYLLTTQAPWKKYGATGAGSPDLFADLPFRNPPDKLPQKIHGVSPESIALRKFYHPEEFEGRRT